METIYKKVKYLILTIGLFMLFNNNIKMDYHVLAEKQKPSFEEALSFINGLILPKDMIFFPIYMSYPNFLYYAEKHNYSQLLLDVLKQSQSPLSMPGFLPDKDFIPGYIARFSSSHERLWIIVVYDKILEREVFNLNYPNMLLRHLSENYKLVLNKSFKYMDIYLFQLS